MNEPTALRRNIALTGPAEIAKDYVIKRLHFGEGQAAARFGLAYAINKGLEPVRGSDFGSTVGQNMAVSGFDPTQEIAVLLRSLHPDCEDPYVVAETLMSVGLVQLERDLREGLVSKISDLSFAEPDGGGVAT